MDDVAADTRIRATLIRAIETDDFRMCGGTVYARGHIRSIARVVGVDPGPLIAEFDVVHHVEHAAAGVAPQATDHTLVSRSERHQPNWTAAMGVALAVICVLALAPLLFRHSSSNPPLASPQHTASPQTTPSSQLPVSPPPSAVAELPASRATMLVRASAKTWLSITTKSGQKLFEGLLNPGEQKVFSARHGLVYVIGNAPGVDLVVNGHDIGSPPSSNVVAKGNVAPGADTVQEA